MQPAHSYFAGSAFTLAVVASCGTPQAVVDATVDAPRFEPALTHVLYLAVDGVTLTPGNDDATANRSAIVPRQVALGGFLATDPDRQTEIAAIVSQLEMITAPYDITITTTRPASGDYSMIVMTDDSASLVDLPSDRTAATRTSCNMRPSPVSFEFGYTALAPSLRRDVAARNALAMFADQAAIPLSTKHGDCMCFIAADCWVGSPCTIGGIDTPIDPNGGCPFADATMNEASVFLDVFGSRSSDH